MAKINRIDKKTDRQGIGGTKTPPAEQGKIKNCLRPGMCSALALHNESAALLESLRANYIHAFQPVGFIELELIEEMVAMKWRQRRHWTMETAAIDLEMDRQRAEESEQLRGLDNPTVAARAVKKLSMESSELNNYNRYERSLHRMYHRALRQLLEFQKARRDGQSLVNTELPPPPPVEEEKLPNELETVENITAYDPTAMILDVLNRIEAEKKRQSEMEASETAVAARAAR